MYIMRGDSKVRSLALGIIYGAPCTTLCITLVIKGFRTLFGEMIGCLMHQLHVTLSNAHGIWHGTQQNRWSNSSFQSAPRKGQKWYGGPGLHSCKHCGRTSLTLRGSSQLQRPPARQWRTQREWTWLSRPLWQDQASSLSRKLSAVSPRMSSHSQAFRTQCCPSTRAP